jgi:16S rRNA (cytosine1402-N4)-methyltransferase
MKNEFFHQSVLLNEAVDLVLNPVFQKDIIIVDATAGGGGYSELICTKLKKNFRLICLDKDINALSYSSNRLRNFSENIFFVNNNFTNIVQILKKLNLNYINGIVFDLGLSSYQLNSEDGFSFMKDTSLDMRADSRDNLNAADVLNSYSKNSLIKFFSEFGEIGNAQRLAKKITETRKKKKFKTTFDLVNAVKEEYKLPDKKSYKFLAKIFQALRIEVNNELENLQNALEESYNCLLPGGRIVAVSYHSLEDRIVKNYFKSKTEDEINVNRFKILTKKPLMPAYAEIKSNPRSRSAKLRSAEKI